MPKDRAVRVLGWVLPATLRTPMWLERIHSTTRATGIGSRMSTSIEGLRKSRMAVAVHFSPRLAQFEAMLRVPSEVRTFLRVLSL